MKASAKIISGVIGCAVGSIAVTAIPFLSLVISDASKKHRDACDYLMILGGNVIGADTPSPQLFERMRAAAVYLKENEECFAVPCGGSFRPEQKKSEAQIIADYLIEQGIDKNRIILEAESTTTFENFEFALKIIEEHSGKNITDINTAFLSSDYHVFRASKIAECCGFEKIGKVSCLTPADAKGRYFREYICAFELFAKIIKKKISL